MNDLLNAQVAGYLGGSSMIRRMFEAGIELKKKFGADKVYDFSLGNPDLPPPPEIGRALAELAAAADQPFALGYMPNAGFPELREALAEVVSAEQKIKLTGSGVVVTCGAAGGLNVLFRAILAPGDEVIAPSPYFVEYDFYAANAGGKLVPAPSRDFTFELDMAAFEAAFTERTRAIILNSPNNPTGQIYSAKEIAALGELVHRMEKKFNRTIYVISDEPYRFLNFDGVEIPAVFEYFEHAVVIGSFSKNLSLAGERMGYIAVSPRITGFEKLVAALVLCNRILGFVNAPVIGQKLLLKCLGAQVDLEIYRKRRDAMARVLTAAGVRFTLPRGAFYFFAQSPVPDEQQFVDALFNEHVLVVPGRGFGRAGYVRIAFCVATQTIENSASGFAAAVAALKK